MLMENKWSNKVSCQDARTWAEWTLVAMVLEGQSRRTILPHTPFPLYTEAQISSPTAPLQPCFDMSIGFYSYYMTPTYQRKCSTMWKKFPCKKSPDVCKGFLVIPSLSTLSLIQIYFENSGFDCCKLQNTWRIPGETDVGSSDSRKTIQKILVNMNKLD